MTPGARIQATIELLDRIERPPPGLEDVPADAAASSYFRDRRYIGAKDRRYVGDLVFRILRERAALDARLGAAAGNRLRALLAAATEPEALPADEIAALCDGGAHRPAALTGDESAAFAAARTARAEALAPWQAASYPEWLAPEIERRFGADAPAEMRAYLAPAHVYLRVNALKATRDEAARALAKADIASQPTPFSPVGLKLAARAALNVAKPYRDGWVEVQDEASQIAALLAGAAPGMSVLDLCAGAGGKTLALAASMANTGSILACDTSAKRLDRMDERLARSGATIVRKKPLGGEGAEFKTMAQCDRVVVDAPCSGSGTWRRSPDGKWRLTAARLDLYRLLQGQALRDGARLTKPGGRLIYAVCSILPTEAEDQIAAFLAERAEFRIVPLSAAWAQAMPGAAPCPDPFLFLTPHRHGTDGFFAAVLERAA